MKNKILENIFSVKNEDYHKVLIILGVKIKFKSPKLIDRYNTNISFNKVNDSFNKVNNILKDIYSKENKLIEKFEIIKTKTINTDRIVNNIRKMGNEAVILPNDYFPYMDSHSLKDDYLNLIRNLDGQSVLNVQKALAKIQQVKTSGNDFHFLKDEDMEDFRNFKSDFEKAIVQLDENTWAYKDYLLPVQFFDSSVFYFGHNLKDYKTLDYNKSVIDAGASIGDSAVFLSKQFKGNIYSFEPITELFETLNKSVELNGLKNVYTHKIGLLNEECDKNMYFAGKCGQSTSINEYRNNGENEEKVHFTTIDKFVKENNIEVGLIKADVEGAERFLLEGAIETIKTQKPALNISIYHSAMDFFKIKPMIESLNLGYKFKISKPSLSNIVVETCLLAEVIDE